MKNKVIDPRFSVALEKGSYDNISRFQVMEVIANLITASYELSVSPLRTLRACFPQYKWTLWEGGSPDDKDRFQAMLKPAELLWYIGTELVEISREPHHWVTACPMLGPSFLPGKVFMFEDHPERYDIDWLTAFAYHDVHFVCEKNPAGLEIKAYLESLSTPSH